MRSAFPAAQLVTVELTFMDPEARPPAAQTHAMHPPARAYFEFPCPYANCDGNFDLNEAVRHLLEKSSPRASGSLECQGLRSKDGVTKQACGVRAGYVILATYRSAADADA